ncbi:MAG: DUF6062 family protein [Chloroflexi bacterium]|nr:DUF6062 family protein [Chloroflexota bacterium]MCL5274676.1 DUF6062 family protein [Chloroflexota bacterium]
MENQFPIDYYSLLEACGLPGCPLCNLLLHSTERLLDSLLYEQVNESETQRAVRARRGLCNTHAWQMSRMMGNALGIAILYRAAVDEALGAIKRATPKAVTQSGLERILGMQPQQDALPLAAALEPTQPCMACSLSSATEQRYLGTFKQYISDERLLAALRASNGLCLNHFSAALRQMHDPAGLGQLIGIQREIWSRLQVELQEFIDKNDYRRMREPMGTERDSWQRALRAMAGEPGVFGVDPQTR